MISVLELISFISSGDVGLSPEFEQEITKLSDIMENKRLITEPGGGFMDLHAYKTAVATPALKNIISERVAFLSSGARKKIFKDIHNRLNEEYNN